MVNKQEIILRYFREGDSARKIGRDLGMHRLTIRRYITEYLEAQKQSASSGCKDVLHESLTRAPKYKVGQSRPKKKLTESIAIMIDGYSADNERKVKEGLAKQRMRRIDILEALKAAGQDIGYTTVCEYIKAKVFSQREAYIRQEYQPGVTCEFDWAEVRLMIGGVRRCLYRRTGTHRQNLRLMASEYRWN